MPWENPPGKRYFGKPVTDDPDDAPELLEDFFEDAVYRVSGRTVSREEFAALVQERTKAIGKPDKS
ncbi:hypothetical protein [Rhodopseudomonas palustris]|uniref:hypothetical protein n=1 Tax=Rhodopseudomonas palustris TaxID=1076 RepID=UPI000EDACC39|nr:hypothetical protein [Rhodopseudomonas palustris]QLH72141.1 hypothetical protein HZF03_15625 [Rhodopseudomonas palustris]RIA02193.1 hypothetical protein D1920_08450 [Rhodopseudomonas palustris]